MAHNHSHTGHGKALKIAFIMIAGFAIIEAAAGFYTGSLALLSDAGHMTTDALALGLAILAVRIGGRAADANRTFGYRRLEIMAAFFNAALLLVIAVFILYEAWHRFAAPPTIAAGPMLVVGSLGLAVNLIALRLLHGGKEQLNVKGAYLEVLADTLGSAGVILAALVMHFTGWWPIDPIIATLIGLWVLPRAFGLIGESMNILMEGVPKDVALAKLHEELLALTSVESVHELHAWAITSGQYSLTAHLLVAELPRDDSLLNAARAVAAQHDIHHTSFQIELAHCDPHEASCGLGHSPH